MEKKQAQIYKHVFTYTPKKGKYDKEDPAKKTFEVDTLNIPGACDIFHRTLKGEYEMVHNIAITKVEAKTETKEPSV